MVNMVRLEDDDFSPFGFRKACINSGAFAVSFREGSQEFSHPKNPDPSLE